MGRTLYFVQKNRVFFIIFHLRGPTPKGVVQFLEESGHLKDDFGWLGFPLSMKPPYHNEGPKKKEKGNQMGEWKF